jgi:sugar phosphate permease
MLSMGMLAQTASCAFVFGLPFLVPQLRDQFGLSLGQVGLLVGCPSAGTMLSLIAWGALADRYGERVVMFAGLGGAAIVAAGAGFVRQPVWLGALLVLAGAGAASVNAASGRMVLGWFPPRQRGLAMGWRQTGQPLGVALAGAILPDIGAHAGIRGALFVLAGICGLAAVAVAVFVVDPPRSAAGTGGAGRAANPYRRPILWRIHGASALLVVPQFAVSAFALTYLVTERRFGAGTAGQLVAAAGLAGAAVRLLAGRLSDRMGSRLRPMRRLALATTAVVGLLALAVAQRSAAGTVLVLAAAVITGSTNGLAFTAVAELAGGHWAGRALGAQNTVQNLAAAVTPPVFGMLIAGGGFGIGYAVAAAFPLLAAAIIPSGGGARSAGDPADEVRPAGAGVVQSDRRAVLGASGAERDRGGQQDR